ncbi:MAG: hypothetical protein V3R37_01755 [Rhodospirillales bacterium]
MAILVSVQFFAYSAANADTHFFAYSPDKDEAPAKAVSHGPVAMVEGIENAPNAGVAFLDYVYADQKINLGANGKVVLSYFDTCLTETIVGGRVTVAPGASEVEDGQISVKAFPCQGAKIIVTAETSEAGATVNRVTPFDGQNWLEWTVKTAQPLFKWPASEGETFVRVFDMDMEAPEMIWQGEAKSSHLTYPASAPKLQIGRPYRVQVSRMDEPIMATMFSIDPDLDIPDTLMSRVIPVKQ